MTGPARLSAVLKEGEVGRGPIQGRTVTLAIGAGAATQACTAATDDGGTASCAIASVDQPLNADATVPVTADFGGDDYYLGSHDAATARLRFYTAAGPGNRTPQPGRATRLGGHPRQ